MFTPWERSGQQALKSFEELFFDLEIFSKRMPCDHAAGGLWAMGDKR
jgi:hypothetical protein